MGDLNSQTAGGSGGGVIATSETEIPPAAPPRTPRKSGCGCMLPMLLLLATLGFAPQIVTMTSLRNQLPALLMAELPPGVVIGSASAGWVSPMQLTDVMIPDDQGRPSLKLKHVTLSKSLWELAKSSADLGTIAVEKPELKIYLDNGVSNYDKFLQRLAAKKGSGARSLIDLQLTEGEITLREESRKKTAVAEKVPAEVLPGDAPPVAIDTSPAPPVLGDARPAGDQPPTEQPLAAAPNAEATSAPQEAPIEGQLLAIIDLQKATFKSQAKGDEELIGELTAKLREPAVEEPLTGELRWNLPDGQAAGIGSGKLKLVVPEMPLGVLSPWLASLTAGRDLSGLISLDVAAEVVPSNQDLLLAAQISVPHLDLRLGPAEGKSQPFGWVGDNLKLIAEGQGDLAGKRVTIESVQLRTPIVNADFSGTVQDIPGQAICNLTGKCDLNPEDLLALVPPEWADRIQFNGLQLGQIRIEGALRGETANARSSRPVVESEPVPAPASTTATPLRIQADVQWASANVMGFKSENALVNVDWSERQLAFNPNRLPIGQGQWVASPRIEFTPEGRHLVFDGGPVFENVDFTQEMSNTWLRYVSPLLGSATSIEGKFSLSASPARVAMSPPHAGDFEGVLNIHSAQVGPGALSQQIVEAIAGIQTMLGRPPAATALWMQVDEQQVPFAFADGRVYHKDLHVSFGDVVVQSQGSVGLDQTIDFQLSIPIPEKWAAGKPLLANLKGEVIPFQMGGTLDQPQLDGRALGEFAKRIAFKGGGGLLQQLIEKRLEKKANGEIPTRPRRKR